MAIGSGLSAQLGFAAESTVGTIVAPDHFVEFNSETLSLQKGIVQGGGLRAGVKYPRAARRSYTTRSAGGDLNLDVGTRGMGLLFKSMLGVASAPAAAGSGWQYVFTPGSLNGQSLTIQKGVPQTDGTVKPFTYNGCKVIGWKVTCAVGGILQLSLSIDAINETTATSLGTAAYTSSDIFHFAEGTLYLGGTVATTSGIAAVTGGTAVASVKAAEVTGSNPMKTDRQFFGSSGLKKEPIENNWGTLGGSLNAEFTNQATIYDLYAADLATALQLTFTAPASGGVTPVFDVLIPNIHFDGDSPQVGGPDVVDLKAGFTGLSDPAGNAAVQFRYVTADAAL